MHIGQISFCDGVGYNIKSNEDKEHISIELKEYGISVISKRFEKFGTESSLRAIKSKPHLLSARTHGNPYFLYLTRISGVPHCIFIDKKIQHGYFQPRMILTKLWFEESLFSGTIFEGEMVRLQENKWTFIISDILVERQEVLHNVNLVKRINLIYKILSTQFVSDGLDPCILQVKKYFPYEKLDELRDTFIPSLPYNVTGIIFKSLYLKFKDILFDTRDEKDIIKGRQHSHASRQKIGDGSFVKRMDGDTNDTNHNSDVYGAESDLGPSIHHERFRNQIDNVVTTVYDNSSNNSSLSDSSSSINAVSDGDEYANDVDNDEENLEDDVMKAQIKTFRIRKTSLPDVYELIDRDQRVLERNGLACIPNMSTSKHMRKIFKDLRVTDSIEMECMFHAKFKKWVPCVCSNNQ